jgi:tRNA G18 (ribose-2'-O)-methylase SpoU
MIAILQNIRSLYNVGSIFRTADAAGIKKLYLCGITPTPLDRFGDKRKELTKVSLGAEDYVQWEKIGNSPRPNATLSLIEKLKKDGYEIIAIEQDKNSIPYSKFKTKNNKLALIVGDEVRGISKSILKHCNSILEIPMRGKKESLNVSVAFGIVAYSLLDKS